MSTKSSIEHKNEKLRSKIADSPVHDTVASSAEVLESKVGRQVAKWD
jgi:hypothetical protein